MNTSRRPMFPRLRLLMMLVMLLSMVSSLSFTVSAQDNGTTGPTAELCHALDTDDNLSLSPNELRAFKGDLNGDSVSNDADIDILSSFCAALPSLNLGGMVTICHATGSESKPYEVITIAAAAVVAGHLGGSHQSGEDIIPVFTFGGETFGPQGDLETLANGCVPLPPPPDPGTLHVQKYYCDDVEAATVVEDDFDTTGCEAGTATFVILDSNDQSLDFNQDELLNGTLTLPVGDYTLLEYDKNNDLVLSVPFTIVEDANTIIRIANPLDPGPEPGRVIVEKFYCEGTAFEGPTVVTEADEFDFTDCELGTADFLVGDPEGTPLTVDVTTLFTTGVELMPGSYTLLESLGDTNMVVTEFSIPENQTITITVVNPVEDEPDTGTVIVEKYFCDDPDIEAPVVGDPEEFDDCVAGTAVFDLLDDTLANGGTSVLGAEDDLFAGVELPFGTYYLVEMFDGEWIEMATVVIGPNATELTYTVINPGEEEEPGLAKVIKYFCTDEGITVPVVGDEESSFEGCEPATAEQLAGVNFWVYPFGDAEAALDIDDAALLGDGVVLPVGTHTLVEEFKGVIHEMADLTIVAGETTTIVVFNPSEMERTVDLDIYKAVCEDVDEADAEDPCTPSDALHGQTIEYVALALDGEGEIIAEVDTSLVIEDDLGSAVVEDLPEADFYAVCEVVPEGVETVYIYSLPTGELFEVEDLAACILIAGDDIDDTNLIEVLFLNDMEDEKPEEPEEPEKPGKPDVIVPQKPAPTVTGLPDTGSGPAGTTSMAPWLLLGAGAVLAGTGVILRKERPAA